MRLVRLSAPVPVWKAPIHLPIVCLDLSHTWQLSWNIQDTSEKKKSLPGLSGELKILMNAGRLQRWHDEGSQALLAAFAAGARCNVPIGSQCNNREWSKL